MKKKVLSIALVSMMAMGIFAGCNNDTTTNDPATTDATTTKALDAVAEKVDLSVVTSFGGDDGNRANYEKAYKDWMAKTGNTVKDASGTAVDEWKIKVMTDFEVGAEPDVLFYYNGADSNDLVNGNKVVSIDEIREVYPDYASNMKDDMMVASPADGKVYAVPLIGYWEAMYVNKYVLEQCGVNVPGDDYTWDQFLADCETIKSKGFTPIAASIHEVPNYWFEFCVYNYTTPATHNAVPGAIDDNLGKAWVNGLNDIKALYEKGYFPKNTTSATDAETAQLMVADQAAFMIGGSWKRGYFEENMPDTLDHMTVTFPPSNGQGRKTTDMIGGISMGYFITRKCWEDPAKQAAAVDFVNYMVSTPVLSTFSAGNVTACKDPLAAPENASSLLDAVNAMNAKATGLAGAAQDNLDADTRTAYFGEVKNIATGKISAEDATKTCIEGYKAANA